MDAIHRLASEFWVQRLGWTLVHFLWQGLLIAILYGGSRRAMGSGATANARYLLACTALAAMMAAPLATWSFLHPSAAIPEAAYRIRSTPPEPSTTSVAPPSGVLANVPEHTAEFLPWVVIAWLVGAAGFGMRLAGGWVVAARMRSLLVRRAPAEWQQRIAQLGGRINVSRSVHVLVSALVQVPTVVGWLRPAVLVPIGALSGLHPDHLEALLLHELAHIRRHDYLVNMLQSVAEALLFYHPAVWWVSGHIRMERELCCDDVAVSVTGDVLTYARALAELESSRPAHLNPAMAANGGSLSGRIARLLGQSKPAPQTGLGAGVVTAAVLMMVAAYGLFGQPESHPAFQAASVKRNTTVNPRGMRILALPGGRLRTENASTVLLIQNAYRVQTFQIVGGPAWINDEGYDIEAKPDTNTSEQQMWLMAQTLLADRFKLAVHRETRELPAWSLTAAKGGIKLPPPRGEGCISADPSAPAPPAPARGALPNIPCGSFRVGRSPIGLRIEGQKAGMAEFVRILSMVLGRPVLNGTGVTGDLDVQLDFTPDETTAGLPGGGGPRDPGFGASLPSDPNRPNIVAALQEQLGLKLASSKGPVEVLVIDHVERPSAN